MRCGKRQRRGQEWKEQVLRCARHFCCLRLVPPPVGWGQEGHDTSPRVAVIKWLLLVHFASYRAWHPVGAQQMGVLTTPPRGRRSRSWWPLLWECLARISTTSGLEPMVVPPGVRGDPSSGLALQGAQVRSSTCRQRHMRLRRVTSHSFVQTLGGLGKQRRARPGTEARDSRWGTGTSGMRPRTLARKVHWPAGDAEAASPQKHLVLGPFL